jgi:hypothetical protein
MKLYVRTFLENLPRKFKFLYNLTRITCALHEDQYTFWIISRSVLLRIRNVSGESFRENHNSHLTFNNVFFEIRTVLEVLFKNTVQPDRPQMKIKRMCTECWTSKTTNTHRLHNTSCVSINRWLHKRTSMLDYTHIAQFVRK